MIHPTADISYQHQVLVIGLYGHLGQRWASLSLQWSTNNISRKFFGGKDDS